MQQKRSVLHSLVSVTVIFHAIKRAWSISISNELRVLSPVKQDTMALTLETVSIQERKNKMARVKSLTRSYRSFKTMILPSLFRNQFSSQRTSQFMSTQVLIRPSSSLISQFHRMPLCLEKEIRKVNQHKITVTVFMYNTKCRLNKLVRRLIS